MATDWASHLEQWVAAGFVDGETAGRIREWERERAPAGLRWPILIALALAAVLLGAGVLLFVSAHWDELGPAQRMTLVLLLVAVFHVAGGFVAKRFDVLSIALHTTGTVALGAGIALAGQIFHLSAHWPAAILLWAIGAAVSWALSGHWTQGALVAILVPYWLAGEWWVHTSRDYLPVWAGFCALSFTYLSARRFATDSALRKALGWMGGLALLPAVCAVVLDGPHDPKWTEDGIAWSIALLFPLAVGALLRRREATWNAVAVLWTTVLVAWQSTSHDHLVVYVWCALGAVGLAAWGIRDARVERVNLGIAGFAITVLAFYFSNVMDMLGRSASLIGLGLLFLGGGWLLERTRRRLVGQIRAEAI